MPPVLSGGQSMGNMDSWDVTLLVVAAYLAIVTLVRLMARHRNQVLNQFRRQAEDEKKLKRFHGDLPGQRKRSA
jgi:hypothetical protein